MESSAALSVVATFTLILDGLLNAIGARIADYPFTCEMVTFLWKRVNTVKNRFLALAALVQAGRIPRERAGKPRERQQPGTAWPDGINWRKWLPMGRFAWLCWLMPSLANRFGAAQFGDQLRHLLGQPAMRALLAATPKAGRLLAPLCFMLGIEDSLLRTACPAPPMPAPEIMAPEIVAPKTMAPGPCAIFSDNSDAPLPPEDLHESAADPSPEPGVEFFVPA